MFRMGSINDHLDQPQNGRVKGIGKLRHFWIGSVSRHGVLAEIIGTDGEEIHFLCQLVCNDRRRGDLDHDADLRIFRKRNPFFSHFILTLIDDLHGLAHAGNGCHHGEHDLEIMPHPGA